MAEDDWHIRRYPDGSAQDVMFDRRVSGRVWAFRHDGKATLHVEVGGGRPESVDLSPAAATALASQLSSSVIDPGQVDQLAVEIVACLTGIRAGTVRPSSVTVDTVLSMARSLLTRVRLEQSNVG